MIPRPLRVLDCRLGDLSVCRGGIRGPLRRSLYSRPEAPQFFEELRVRRCMLPRPRTGLPGRDSGVRDTEGIGNVAKRDSCSLANSASLGCRRQIPS